MTYLLILLSVILHFINKKRESKATVSLNKYRAFVVMILGGLMILLLDNGQITAGVLICSVPFIFIGVYFFIQDYLTG